MCGICGAAGFDDDPALARKMAQAMTHRGPDGEGFLDRRGTSLGMRRLRIIDLVSGDQPIYNEDRSVGIVFNGEIYNYHELQRELQSLGHRFATQSDTETIVHAYEEWGLEAAKRLRGMFALAILDCRPVLEDPTQAWRLVLARDRLGIKPLYTWQEGDRLLFASEVRSILASGQVTKKLSPAGLTTYLSFGSLQEPLTLVEGIFSLPPGCTLLVQKTARGLDLRCESYWEPPVSGAVDAKPEEVQGWLAEAVGCHLESDVPLGAFLSGGLDSGSIVALGSRVLGKAMQTFNIAFDGWMGNEGEAARLTAQRWHSEHLVRTIRPEEIIEEIDLAMAAMDQPTVDGINSWYISREAKRAGLTVALSGVGGDELFAGYPSFRLAPQLDKLPHPLQGLRRLPGWEEGWKILPGTPDSRRKLAAYLDGEVQLEHPYFAVRGLFTRQATRRLIKPTILDEMDDHPTAFKHWIDSVGEQVQIASRYDRIGEISWLELSQYMRSTLLRDTDMMSMAHSLEVRVPLVDHHLVERVLPVGWNKKVSRDRNKPLLARAMDGLLPREVINRPKTTFTLPFETWIREGLAERVRSRLSGSQGCLTLWSEGNEAAHVWSDFERKRTNWARPWALFILDEWLERNFG